VLDELIGALNARLGQDFYMLEKNEHSWVAQRMGVGTQVGMRWRGSSEYPACRDRVYSTTISTLAGQSYADRETAYTPLLQPSSVLHCFQSSNRSQRDGRVCSELSVIRN
jgi:hypothetical protein